MRIINDGHPPKPLDLETFKLLALVRFCSKPVNRAMIPGLWAQKWKESIDLGDLARLVERAAAEGLVTISGEFREFFKLTLVGKRSVDERRRLGELRALRQGSGRE